MANDTSYDKVTLLLPLNGANNGTVLTDYSLYQKAVTLTGTVKTVTAQYKYYDSSAYFDGTAANACVSRCLPTSGDFTIEAWLRLSDYTSKGHLFSQYDPASSVNGRLSFGVEQTTGLLRLFIGDSEGNLTLTSSNQFGTGAWVHAAVCRASNVFKLFIGGSLEATSSVYSAAIADKLSYVGAYGTEYLQGYVQDLRVTTEARYSLSFTPPTKLIGTISNGGSGVPAILNDAGSGCVRRVQSVPRLGPSGARSTTSDSSGRYSIMMPITEQNVIFLDDESGTRYNDILVSRVLPV